MASRKEQKQRLREERQSAEAEAAASARRKRARNLIAGAVAVSIVVILALVLVSQSGDSGDGEAGDADAVEQELAGIEQSGFTLGDPDAAVRIVEYGDLQCPACKAFSESITPELIESQVRTGEASLEFQNWTIIGPDSITAAKAALAASEQGRYWSFVELFYANQGQERSGYVTDQFLEQLAVDAGVEDLERWREDRELPKWDETLAATEDQAVELGLSGTPSIVVEGPGGVEVLGTPDSLETIEQAVESVRA